LSYHNKGYLLAYLVYVGIYTTTVSSQKPYFYPTVLRNN